jgi:23S rRNA pseudouridine2457 synthase
VQADRYFIVYKPYKMLSQFKSGYEQIKLGALDFCFPEGTNAVGRLDYKSEGLLILTTDGSLTKRLLHPARLHTRKYLVQVEKEVSEETLTKLRAGVEILVKLKGAYTTKVCEVSLVGKPTDLPYRDEPLLERIPCSWLEFVLTEGKNRQIRKMCTATRHKCHRLIRTAIEDITIQGMQPGEVREISREELFRKLKL